MRTYGQYCPVARTSELLAERWTPIIIRNRLTGCRTFAEIRQGAPGIPPALLTKRLGPGTARDRRARALPDRPRLVLPAHRAGPGPQGRVRRDGPVGCPVAGDRTTPHGS